MSKLFLVLFFFVCLGARASVTVVSWNLKHLGNKSQDREFISYLLTAQDLVLLQEVNQKDSGTEALTELADLIGKRMRQKICIGFSDPPTGERNERYAMMWVEKTLAYVTTNGEVLDRCPEFAVTLPLVNRRLSDIVREPAYAIFMEKASRKKFLAATVHLVPESKGPRKEVEPVFDALKSTLEDIAGRTGRLPAVLGGDFNLDVADGAFNVAREMGYQSVLDAGTATTLRKTVPKFLNPFDNFFVRRFKFQRGEVAPVYKKYAAYRKIDIHDIPRYQIEKIFNTVSDHAPIRVRLEFQD